MILNVINYLTKDSIGLIVLAIMTSFLSSILYSACQYLFKKVCKQYKHKKQISYMMKSAVSFIYGARAVKIQCEDDGALQSFWAADFIMTAICYVLKIVLVLGLTLIVFYLLPPFFYFLPVIVSSICLTLLFKKFRRNQKYFDMSLDLMFGEEYLQKEKEGYQGYWKNMMLKDKGKSSEKNVD